MKKKHKILQSKGVLQEKKLFSPILKICAQELLLPLPQYIKYNLKTYLASGGKRFSKERFSFFPQLHVKDGDDSTWFWYETVSLELSILLTPDL